MSARSGSRMRTFVGLAIAAALVTACTDDDDTRPAGTTTPTTTATITSTAPDADPGSAPLGFAGIRLGEGQAPSGTPAAAVVAGTPLDDAAVGAVVDRLEPLTADAAEAVPFAWPAETITRPQGPSTDVPFPAAEQVDPAPTTPATLEVARIQPDGPVGLAPFVTITFNQPMVPVGTVSQLAAADVPATITPAVEGHWQWIGTSTLRFDAATRDRLPMATDFRVTVPAGTSSASGAVLAARRRRLLRHPACRHHCAGGRRPRGPAAAARARGRVRPARSTRAPSSATSRSPSTARGGPSAKPPTRRSPPTRVPRPQSRPRSPGGWWRSCRPSR